MKNIIIKALLVIVLTLVIGFIWLNNAHLFPKPPERFALFLVEWFDAKNQEDISNIEVLYVLCGSAVVSIFIVFISGFVHKKILTHMSRS